MNIDGSPAQSVSGTLQVALADGRVATVEIESLDLSDLAPGTPSYFISQIEYPDAGAGGSGAPYLTVGARLKISGDSAYKITTPPPPESPAASEPDPTPVP